MLTSVSRRVLKIDRASPMSGYDEGSL
jgi:hypothetical protein